MNSQVPPMSAQPPKQPKVHKSVTLKRRTLVLTIIGVGIIGVMLGSSSQRSVDNAPVAQAAPTVETKTVTRETTPQSCKDVISLDNTIYVKIGTALQSYPDMSGLDEVTQYMNDNVASRTANITDCTSK